MKYLRAKPGTTAVGLLCLFCGNLLAQQSTPMPVVEPPAPPPKVEYAEPPEEDQGFKTQEYNFNPLQAKKEIDAGNVYFHKGNFRAAANRYREATLWDDSAPDGFYKLGEAYEKMKSYGPAREAWTKFAELTDDKGKANDVRKKMAQWPAAPASAAQPDRPSAKVTADRAEELLKAIEKSRR